MQLNIRNVFGNAETLTGKSSYGVDSDSSIPDRNDARNSFMQGASAHHLSFVKPIGGDPDTIFDATVYKLNRNNSQTMGFQETDHGISLTQTNTLQDGFYKFGYQGVWRENHSIKDNASLTYF